MSLCGETGTVDYDMSLGRTEGSFLKLKVNCVPTV